MGARYSAAAQKILPGPRLARTNHALLAGGPIGAAAIRIPDRLSAQLSLVFPTPSPRLFVHEGARQSLERRLRIAFSGPVSLSITDNRHSIVSHSTHCGVLMVRIHHMFLDAPAHVVDALVHYMIRADRTASQRVSEYIEAQNGRLARRKARSIPLTPRGKCHDLLEIFREVNERYFEGGCNVLVTWGTRGTRARSGADRASRKSVKLGSYSDLDRLIRLHPVLDRSWVPRYFVAFVLYHEMLHHMMPAKRSGLGARRELHPAEFREQERMFRAYDRAIAWEKRSLSRLLRVA
jgi:hypothetical protein